MLFSGLLRQTSRSGAALPLETEAVLPISSAASADDLNTGTAGHGSGAPFGSVRLWTPWLLGLAFAFLSLRLALFVNRYAVDLLYWDQWDFLQGLFDGADAWTLFRWQHGPQRQGIGNLLHAALYAATGWNTRADAGAAAVLLALAAAGGLWLVKRVGGSLRPWDAAVPLIFLTTSSAEMYFVAPNLAHGPVPTVLLVAYGLALTIPSHSSRCVLLVAINFLAVNTGFTLLLGSITPAILLLQACATALTARERALSAAAIAACLATVALFFHGFVLHPASDCFQFPHVRPWEYVPYTGFVLARAFGVQAGEGTRWLLFGTAATCAMAAFVAYAAFRLVQSRGDSPIWAIVASFTTYSLLFGLTTAVGRVCLGFQSANASRYIPYMLPGMLALYLAIRMATPTLRAARALLPLFLVACIAKELPEISTNEARAYQRYKQRWRQCYVALHDIQECDMRAGHQVYPAPQATHLQEKLDWLETRRLNLFRDRD